MLNCFGKINWKQNQMNLSEVLIDVKSASKKEVKFRLNEDMVNHIFQKCNDKIEMHFRFGQSDQIEIYEMDFSKLKPVKPAYPSLRKKMSPPKIDPKAPDADAQQNGKIGVYSIFHPGSNRWLTRLGWGYVQNYFDIVPEKTNTSRLSVAIEPKYAVDEGAAWGIKKIEWQSSTSKVPVPKGDCLVEFKPLEGWDAPKAQNIYVGEDADNTISARYTLSRPSIMRQEPLNVIFVFLLAFFIAVVSYYLGNPLTPSSLSAAISPPEVVSQGAQWRIEKGNWQTGNDMLELEAGEYSLEFKPVDGWQSPPVQKINLKEGQVSQIEAAYTKMLVVKIIPEEAASDGAQWKLEGESRWHVSGDRLPLHSSDANKIIYKDINGWASPAEKIIQNSEDTVTAEYQRIPSPMATAVRSITVQISPPEAVQAGARWKLEGPGDWKVGGEKISGLINIAYTVIFKGVKGWKKPGNLEFSDHGSGMTAVKGVYKKIVAEEARTNNSKR